MNKKNVSIVIIINNGKILVLKRAEGNRSYPGKWNFPGGGVELNEDIYAAAVREVSEESGLQIQQGNLIYLQRAETPTLILHIFITNKYNGSVEINDESTDYSWVYPDDILDIDFIPISKNMIDDIKFYMGLLNE
jgi:8-oxo-dGTP diphosphatase